MAKKKSEIEEAVVVTEEIKELQVNENSLPAVPEVFYIEDKKSGELVQYSIDVAVALEKEIDTAIKGIKGFSDKPSYDKLEELKNKAVKLRTTPENKRKELSRPISNWLTELKSKTDKIGAAAKKAEEKAEAELTKKKEWEEEQERIKEEAEKKLAAERSNFLLSLDAQYNPNDDIYRFPYDESILFNTEQLKTLSEEEWDAQKMIVLKARNADIDRKKAEDEAKKVQDLARIQMRGMMLQMAGATLDSPGKYSVNGHGIHEDRIKDMTDMEWLQFMKDIQTPAHVVSTPQPSPSPAPPAPSEVTPLYAAKFGGVSAQTSSTVNSEQHGSIEVSNAVGDDVHVTCTFVFTEQNPFITLEITAKSQLRLFPDQFKDKATEGIKSANNTGVFHGAGDDVYWILFQPALQ